MILLAHLTAACEALTRAVLWCGHDEYQIIHPRGNVDRVRQAGEETGY
jgi:hypothetical protein